MTETLGQKFVKAWQSIKQPKLDSVNNHFGNKYASKFAIQNAIREACEPLGIQYRHELIIRDSAYIQRGIITDGIKAIVLSEVMVDQIPNPQAFGSALTYMERYQMLSDWGLAGEEEDDGESATKALNDTRNQRRQRSTDQAQSSESRDDVQHTRELKAMYKQIGQHKDEAIAIGIAEGAMQTKINLMLKGKTFADASMDELGEIDDYITGLIADAKEFNGGDQ